MNQCNHDTCICEESYYELEGRLGTIEDRIDDRIDIEMESLKQKVRELRKQNKFLMKLMKRLFLQLDLKHEDLEEEDK